MAPRWLLHESVVHERHALGFLWFLVTRLLLVPEGKHVHCIYPLFMTIKRHIARVSKLND